VIYNENTINMRIFFLKEIKKLLKKKYLKLIILKMLLKSTTVCCLLLVLALVAISVEAKKNRTKGSHTNSTKWKGYKKKLNLTILQEVADIKS